MHVSTVNYFLWAFMHIQAIAEVFHREQLALYGNKIEHQITHVCS